MRASSAARKLSLTVHVVASVGWLGAVLAFLALAIAGVISDDGPIVEAVYPAMEVVAWAVIVPLGVVSLFSGLVQSLITKWGLLRHYWVVFKLVINVAATVVLLLYLESVSFLADEAARGSIAGGRHGGLQHQALLHSGVALVALLAAIVLSIYKPRGLTAYGRRAERRPG